MKNLFLTVFAIIYLVFLSIPASALDVDVDWICQDPNLWTNLNCWDPNYHIPDNDNGTGDNYHVHFTIGGDTSCTIDGGTNISISSLELSQLTIIHLGPDGTAYLTIEGGPVINDGFINLASNHWDTSFYVAGDVTFSSPNGTGALVIGNDTHNHVRAATPGDRIINNEGHSFQGAQYLGYNEALFTNHGTIKSDIIDAYLYLNPYDSGVNYNDGIIDSTVHSICRIEPSVWDNTNGLIHASDDCQTEIYGCEVYGGEIASEGTGVVYLMENTMVSDIQFSSGNLAIPNVGGANCFIDGTITNNAAFDIANDHFSAHMKLAGDTVLTGNGTIFIGNYGRNFLDSDGSVRLLTQTADHTIHGGDYLGNDLLLFNNQGTIEADVVSGTLDVNTADNGTNYNTGLMAASNQGTLQLTSGTWDNSNGVIEAQDDSIVRFYGATVSNGVLRTTNSGVFEFVQNSHISDTTFESGNFCLPNTGGSNAFISGTINNESTLEIASSHWGTRLKLAADTTFTGNGDIYIGNYGRNYLQSDGTVYTLTNTENHTIHGGDYLGSNQLLFDNKGTIAADVAGWTLYLDASDTDISTSTGTLKAKNQGILFVEPGPWDCTDGDILIEDESTMILNNGAHVAFGTIKTEGTGYIELLNTTTLRDFMVQDSAMIRIRNWQGSSIIGEITNNGSITIESLNNDVTWQCTDATTLNGTGQLTINNTVKILANSVTLTNGEGHTFTVNSSREMEPDIVNNGIMEIPEGVSPQFTGTFVSTDTSTLTVNGTLTCNSGITAEGIVNGTGTLDSSVELAEGGLLSPGASPGTLTITNLEMKSGAAMEFDLDTNGDDLVVITEDLVFGDTAELTVLAPENYIPAGTDHILFQVTGTISDLPTWTIHLPDGWTSDGVVIEESDVVLKNVLLPYGVRIDMPTTAHPGQDFYVTGLLDNPGADATDVAVFFILQVYSEYWFYDSWAHYAPPEANDIDFVTMDIPTGTTEVIVLPAFTWPNTGTTAVDGLLFWGAALNDDMSEIDGRFTMVEWGYGP